MKRREFLKACAVAVGCGVVATKAVADYSMICTTKAQSATTTMDWFAITGSPRTGYWVTRLERDEHGHVVWHRCDYNTGVVTLLGD